MVRDGNKIQVEVRVVKSTFSLTRPVEVSKGDDALLTHRVQPNLFNRKGSYPLRARTPSLSTQHRF